MTVSLEVQPRNDAKTIDKTVHVLGIVYGPKQEATPLAVDRSAFEKLYKEAGESTIISLTGLGDALEVLIHDVDFDPVKSVIRHVDFYAIERGKELTVDVPLEYVGTAPAEELDGVLNKILHEVEVTCRPSNLPHSIEVDLSVLTEIDSQIKIQDLTLPQDVKIENAPEDIVALIAPAREEEEEEPATDVDMDAIEVEHKGKEEAEGETQAEDDSEKE